MTAQQFKTVDVLRLEVGTQAGGALRNLIRNPNGAQGSWGWITPPADAAISASYLDGSASTDLDGTGYLNFASSGPAGVISYFTSEPAPCAAGQYAMAETRLRATLASGRAAEISLVFYDAAGVATRAGVKAIASGTTANTVVRLAAPVAAPAGTVKVALRLDSLGASGGARTLATDHNYLTVGATSAAVTSAAFVDPQWSWTNILTPAHEIAVERGGLTLGTLTASLRDASLDPATNALLRPGVPVRLMARDATGAGALYPTYSPLFVGTIAKATTSYDLTHPVDSERALIQITATDALAVLANMKQPLGVASISDLRYLLEGCGVPWKVNGTNNLVPGAATTVSRNENASVVDQIAATRDTKLGHAWVDRFGVMVVSDAATMTTDLAATLAEADYRHDLDIDFDTTRCVNVVTVKRLALDALGKTVETVFGPYVDRASVEKWGSFAEEFTVQGLPDIAVLDYANSVLAANAQPIRRVQRLAIPITENRHLANGDWAGGPVQLRAHLDLYDRVSVSNTRGGLAGQVLRVATLKHSITAKKWILDVGFASTGGVSLPSPAPELPVVTPPAVASGTVFAGSPVASVAIAFPAGRFKTAPNVQLTCTPSTNVALVALPSAITTAGCTAFLYGIGGSWTAGSLSIFWHASETQ